MNILRVFNIIAWIVIIYLMYQGGIFFNAIQNPDIINLSKGICCYVVIYAIVKQFQNLNNVAGKADKKGN